MARPLRVDLPDYTQHIVQRGHSRDLCFASDDDRSAYLEFLGKAAEKYSVDLHAYILMSNHIHLLATPRQTQGITRMMQLLGRQYVRYFNYSYGRSGSIWEGRYKSSLIDSDHYLLACQRYIELNPVRANMTSDPGGHRWSSYRWHGLGKPDPLLRDHDLYLSLGATPEDRQSAWRDLFADPLDEQQINEIRGAAQTNRALGPDRFVTQMEALLGQQLRPKPRGRPRKPVGNDLTQQALEGLDDKKAK